MSDKAILRRAILLEELEDMMDRKVGRIWTENDARLTIALVREIQTLETPR